MQYCQMIGTDKTTVFGTMKKDKNAAANFSTLRCKRNELNIVKKLKFVKILF